VWGVLLRGRLATLQDSGTSHGGAGSKTKQAHNTPSPSNDNHNAATLGKGRGREGARLPESDFELFLPP